MKLVISKNNKHYKQYYRVVFSASPCVFSEAVPKLDKGYAITQENELPFLKYIGLCGMRRKRMKALFYKGVYTNAPVECKVIGFSHLKEKRCMLIIEFGKENSKKQVVIFSPYFLDMQNKNFKQNEYNWRSEYGMDNRQR